MMVEYRSRIYSQAVLLLLAAYNGLVFNDNGRSTGAGCILEKERRCGQGKSELSSYAPYIVSMCWNPSVKRTAIVVPKLC